MRRWLTIIGSMLMGLSGVAYGSQFVVPMKTDGAWWTTIVSLLGTGGALVGGAHFRTAKKVVGLQVMPEIEALQQADLNALNHLAERFADKASRTQADKDKQAVLLCRTLLSEHLFDLHYPTDQVAEPVPEPVEPPVTPTSLLTVLGPALEAFMQHRLATLAATAEPVAPVTPAAPETKPAKPA